jgi:hypothetical protein
MAQASGKKMGHNPKRAQHGAKGGGQVAPGDGLDEFDMADDIAGDNKLHGDNQRSVNNERQAQAGADGDTDDLLESFKKTEKEYRARAEELKRRDATKDAG